MNLESDIVRPDVVNAAGPPVLCDVAPPFRARTTMGERSLDMYRGRWLVFFSHPADFTPVCTSEFVAFAKASDRFRELGCDLLALSVDSLSSHLAWKHSIEHRFGVRVPFPIVEDPAMGIARAYGMLPANATSSATVRTTVGRSVDEVLRLVAALQATDAADVSTPEGWMPGDPVIVAPPLTFDEITAQPETGASDWYYRLGSA
jgi:peroxiredoxin 2/4